MGPSIENPRGMLPPSLQARNSSKSAEGRQSITGKQSGCGATMKGDQDSGPCLARAALLQQRRGVRETGVLGGPQQGGVCVQRIRHLVANGIHQTLEGLPHADVLLGAGFKEVKP